MKIAASLFLAFLVACTGTGLLDGQSAAAKADQLIGLALTYAEQPDHTPESQVEMTQAVLSLLGVDAAALDAVVPSATGIKLAAKLVAEKPVLAPFEMLIAKGYSYLMYGVTQ